MLSTRVPTAFIIFCAFGLAQRGSPAQSPGTGPEAPPSVTAGIATARSAAWLQHQQMERESQFSGLKWRAVGPRLQGGRIETVAVAPNHSSTIYAGAGSGGVWKSINNGTTWTRIFDKESTASIGSVAVAPSDPNVVWVGTGEVLMAAACSWRTSASFARPQSVRHHCCQDRPRSEMSTPTFRTVFAASVLLGCVAIG